MKNNEKLKLKKNIALNVPMAPDFMEKIANAAKNMHIGKAAFARIAMDEKMKRELA